MRICLIVLVIIAMTDNLCFFISALMVLVKVVTELALLLTNFRYCRLKHVRTTREGYCGGQKNDAERYCGKITKQTAKTTTSYGFFENFQQFGVPLTFN